MAILDHKENLVPNILSIVISSINFIFPSAKINEKLCNTKEEENL